MPILPPPRVNGILRLCCTNPSNLQVQPRERAQVGNVTVRRCRVCERRHFTMHCGDNVMTRPGVAYSFLTRGW